MSDHPELPAEEGELPVVTPRKPVWLELEPSDPADASPHVASEVRTISPGWEAVAASVRGRQHAHAGTYREDSFALAAGPHDWGIVTVGDGAGSAKLSRVGSRLACDAATKELAERLGNFAFTEVNPGLAQPPQTDLQTLRGFLSGAAEAALEAVRVEAQTRGVPERDFHTTLLMVAIAPWRDRHLVMVLQVGDGAVGLMSPAFERGFKCVGFADHGEYSSETRFLTTPGVNLEFRNRVLFVLPPQLDAVAVMTDGVSDDLFPENERLGELFRSEPVAELLAPGGEGSHLGALPAIATSEIPAEELTRWLRYEKRGSFDDRTLVLVRRVSETP